MLPPLKPGDQIGGYILAQNLGKGTLTETWTAKHAKTHEPATLKVFEDWVSNIESVSSKLTAEAEKVMSISHPAMVPLLDYHFATRLGERSFLVMPFIEGDPLHKWLQMKKRRAEDVVKLFLPVMEGLDVLHRQGALHLNVRPSNILVDRNGRAMLTDSDLSGAFELPRAVAADVLEYSSPERLAGKSANPASDVYSIACVLLKSLGGQPPAWATDVHATTKCWIVMPEHAAAFSHGLGSIFDRSLAQDPAARFQSCAELVKALRKWLNGNRSGEFEVMTLAQPKRSGVPWVALGVAGVAGAFVAGYFLTTSGQAVPTRGSSVSAQTSVPTSSISTPAGSGGAATAGSGAARSGGTQQQPQHQQPHRLTGAGPGPGPGVGVQTRTTAADAAKTLDCEKLELELPAACADADCRRKKQTCKIPEF